MKTFLIGMLYSGEAEFDRAKTALAAQTNTDFDFFTIENQPNKLAHDTLYARFMENAANYRYFIKLDADMVLNGPETLAKIESMLSQSEKPLGHLLIDVHDVPSGLSIPGIHIFASSAKWKINSDPLLVDHDPEVPGEVLRHRYLKFVLHNPAPNDFQAFRFGFHRMLKAIQPDRRGKNVALAMMQWSIITSIWREYEKDYDKGYEKDGGSDVERQARWWAILGAEAVFQSHDPSLLEYNSSGTLNLFRAIALQPQPDLLVMLQRQWSDPIVANMRWLQALESAYWLEDKAA